MSEKRILFVGLSSPHDKKKIGSLIIRWAEATHNWNPKTWFQLFFASHVFVIYPAHPKRPFYLVNEAAGTMIRWISEPFFKDHAEILRLYKFEFNEEDYREVKNYGSLQSGAPYALGENLGIAWVRLCFWFNVRVKNPFVSGEAAQKCSELALRNVVLKKLSERKFGMGKLVEVLREKNFEFPPDIDTVGVRDIYEALEWMSDEGLCERVPKETELKVG